jgi:hypothetical protein
LPTLSKTLYTNFVKFPASTLVPLVELWIC